MFKRLTNTRRWPGTKEQPNQYGWTQGVVSSERGEFRVVLTLLHEQTNIPSAIAAMATFAVFRPRYLIFVGIAGSLNEGLRRGDVFIADYIRAYQYGSFSEAGHPQPRSQFQEPTDQTLRTNAAVFNATADWGSVVGEKPDGSGVPHLSFGGLASGDSVVENANVGYFASVLAHDPRLRAVEMESAGVALAVRNLREKGHSVGLMVIRGISDSPISVGQSTGPEQNVNRETRKLWTNYASMAAATFLEQYIKYAFPSVPESSTADIDHDSKNEISGHIEGEVFGSYVSHFASAGEISLIHQINRETFDPNVLIPTATLEAWWRANPQTIHLTRTASGRAVGYWHLLPLGKECYRKISEKGMSERHIVPEDILRYQDLQPGSVYLYIAAVAAREKSMAGSAAVVLDLISFLQTIFSKIGIDGICAQLVSSSAFPLLVKFEMINVCEAEGYSTWVLDSREKIQQALSKGQKEVGRMKGLVPEWPRERRSIQQLLKR